MPASTMKKDELALAYGRDGHTLLKAVYAAAASDPDLAFLARLHQAGVLRVVLVQNYRTVAGKHGREVIKRRDAQVEGLPPGRSRITSPYDTGARRGARRDTFWNGYKVHVTETCDTSAARDDGTAASSSSGSEGHGDDGEAAPPPRLIVNAETTDATVPDSQMTAPVSLTWHLWRLSRGWPGFSLAGTALGQCRLTSEGRVVRTHLRPLLAF